LLRRTQPIAANPETETKSGTDINPGTGTKAESRPGTGPYGVERRKNPLLRFDAPGEQSEQSEQNAPSEPSEPSGVERRRHPRVKLDTPDQQSEQGAPAPARVERRKLERRSMDAVRAELQRNVAPKVEPGIFGSISSRLPRLAMKPSRIVLLLMALLTGGLAAFMASQLNQQTAGPVSEISVPVAKTQIAPAPKMQVLVAKQAIGIGQRLSPGSLEWQDWPKGSVRSDYITLAAMPGAISDMGSDVARFEFFPGDPIRKQKLVQTAQGYLSAVLSRGMRAVSVSVTPASASGGFIVPNDHVDVVLTPNSSTNQISEIILENVRVLAINSRLGETGTTGEPADPANPRAEIFTKEVIATLELDPAKAEVLISATMLGKLSLVLRSMADFSESDNISQRGTNQAIRLTSPFWTQSASQASML